jgi:hypothetical protein
MDQNINIPNHYTLITSLEKNLNILTTRIYISIRYNDVQITSPKMDVI